jgi:hypothetical protein
MRVYELDGYLFEKVLFLEWEITALEKTVQIICSQQFAKYAGCIVNHLERIFGIMQGVKSIS